MSNEADFTKKPLVLGHMQTLARKVKNSEPNDTPLFKRMQKLERRV